MVAGETGAVRLHKVHNDKVRTDKVRSEALCALDCTNIDEATLMSGQLKITTLIGRGVDLS